MLDADTKSSFSDASLDLPPSYDVVAAGSSSPSTSSTAGAAPRAPPKDTLHFFQAPPSFEPLFGRKTTPQDVLEGISYSVKAVDLVTFDSRLQDRKSRALSKPAPIIDVNQRMCCTTGSATVRCSRPSYPCAASVRIGSHPSGMNS